MKEHIEEIRKFVPEPAEIYLHGSRSKLTDLPDDTDWDYAVDYIYIDQILRAHELGWTECVDKSYLDSNSSVVLEKTIGVDKVQVSSRQSLYLFKTVWESLPLELYREFHEDDDNVRLKDWLETHYSLKANEWNWCERAPF